MKKECKIIQDLLPNYIEELVSEDTKLFIDEHLKKCENCQEALENMKEKLTTNAEKVDKTVNCLKRYNRELKVLQIILLIILVSFVLKVGHKVIILNSLENNFEKALNSQNFYTKCEEYSSGKIVENAARAMSTKETYYKDGDYLSTFSFSDENGRKREINYYEANGEKKTFLSSTNAGQETIHEDITNSSEEKVIYRPNCYIVESEYNKLYMAIFMDIDKVQIGKDNCYRIRDGNVERYIDEKTGITIKVVNIKDGIILDMYYEVGNVNEDDIIIPVEIDK